MVSDITDHIFFLPWSNGSDTCISWMYEHQKTNNKGYFPALLITHFQLIPVLWKFYSNYLKAWTHPKEKYVVQLHNGVKAGLLQILSWLQAGADREGLLWQKQKDKNSLRAAPGSLASTGCSSQPVHTVYCCCQGLVLPLERVGRPPLIISFGWYEKGHELLI